MADQTLTVVNEVPRSSAIIHAPPKGKLAFSGDGPDRLLCGGCAIVLAEGVSDGQSRDTNASDLRVGPGRVDFLGSAG